MPDVLSLGSTPGGCDVCAHQLLAHDVVSRRYCTATQAGALSRACICASDVPAVK